MNIEYLPIESIKIDSNQPRKIFNEESLKQLKESIKEKQIEVPLIVRECEEDDSIYILLDGERRLRSAQSLNMKEVPCIIDKLKSIHPRMQEIDVVSKQLRLDFLKNKLTGDELDVALYDLWLSLETVPQEVLTSMGIRSSANRDWRIPFISKETGIGYTQISMSLNKEDFKKRNKDFHEKIKSEMKSDPYKNKRYNRILGETARHEGLRNDDAKRKTVIEEYLNEAISGDGKELRDNLKKISETKSPTETQVREMFGLNDSPNPNHPDFPSPRRSFWRSPVFSPPCPFGRHNVVLIVFRHEDYKRFFGHVHFSLLVLGRATKNVLPSPGLDSKRTEPRNLPTAFLTMARPRPVPPYSSRVWSRLNMRNICLW